MPGIECGLLSPAQDQQSSSSYRVMMHLFAVLRWHTWSQESCCTRKQYASQSSVPVTFRQICYRIERSCQSFPSQHKPWVHVRLTKVLNLCNLHETSWEIAESDSVRAPSSGEVWIIMVIWPADSTWSNQNQLSPKQNRMLQLCFIKPNGTVKFLQAKHTV